MKEKSWYEEWFNSPYYHLLYQNRDEGEAQHFIHALAHELRIPPEARILDVACGKGRHAKTLAKYGFRVTGIDLSSNNIDAARKFECANLHFEVWDFRQVYRENEFDYVFNLFSSFGYFPAEEDDYDSMKAFAGNLESRGTLVLDYINTEYAVKHLKPKEIIQRGEIQFHIQKKVEGGFIKKQIEFLVNGEDHHYEERLKVINRTKFEDMLKSAGLELKKIAGDYEMSEFNSATSPRLILIAQKHD